MNNKIISRDEAEQAIKTLLLYIGEDPNREGLRETPKRVINAYAEMFRGYSEEVQKIFKGKLYQNPNTNGLVFLKDIKFNSYCEHHFLPISGRINICYYPDKYIVGISKIVRLVYIYANRLQLQEKMTSQIAQTLHAVVQAKGVAIKIIGYHSCMSMRGVLQKECFLETTHYTGIFNDNANYKKEFLAAIR